MFHGNINFLSLVYVGFFLGDISIIFCSFWCVEMKVMQFLSTLKYVNIDEIMNFYFENQHSTAAPPDDLELNIQKYNMKM